MKDSKWFSKFLNLQEEVEEVNYKRKRAEVFELFKKNKYKSDPERNKQKLTSHPKS